MTLQEQELEDVITRRTDLIENTTMENNVKEYERFEADNNIDLLLLEEDKYLISSKPRSLSITEFILHDIDSDYYYTARLQAQKSKIKTLALLLSD